MKHIFGVCWILFVLFMFFVAPFLSYHFFGWNGVIVWMVAFTILNILPLIKPSDTDFGGGYY